MKVNKLSLGSVQWGSLYGLSNRYGQTNANEVSRILTKARSEGIRLVDTASSYGNVERVLGNNDLSFFSIVTKIPKFKKNIITKLDVVKSINTFEKSLRRLNQKSCYGILLHHKDDVFKNGSKYLIQALNEIKLRGLVKKIGVSIYDSKKIEKVVEELKPDIVQLPLNVLDQRFIQDGTLEYLKSENVEIHARSVFLQGLLLMPLKKIPTFFNSWIEIIYEWRKVCKEKDLSLMEAALNFVINQNKIDYCLVGVENLSQLKQCILASKSKKKINVSSLACEDINLINPSNWKIK